MESLTIELKVKDIHNTWLFPLHFKQGTLS